MINRLTLFMETIAVYSESHMKPTNVLCGQEAEILNVKAGGVDRYHCALRLKRSQNFFLLSVLMHH
jgi:hypothetical protein